MTVKTKYIRDPVHDLIEIDCGLTQELVNTQVFQRLRNIKQLGLASFVYPGADHSRFSHSLGAFHLALRLTNQLKRRHPKLHSELELRAIPIAALCHDLGHGPFSHLFEKVSKKFVIDKAKVDHEYWSAQILRNHPEIGEVFRNENELHQLVWEITAKAYKRPSVIDIISSELDVDRFDYLLRDSHMTGVKYGNLDLAWIMRCIKPRKATLPDGRIADVLALDGTRGLSVVESYILGRHYMYKHVYWYHTIRCAELMLRNLLERILTDCRSGDSRIIPEPLYKLATSQELSLNEYLALDDVVLWTVITNAATESSAVGDLAKRLVRRKIFKTILYSTEITGDRFSSKLKATEALLSEKGLDVGLYLIFDDPADVVMKSWTYQAQHGKKDKYQPLHYFDKSDDIFELANSKHFINDITYAEKRLYVPPEIYDDVKTIWKD